MIWRKINDWWICWPTRNHWLLPKGFDLVGIGHPLIRMPIMKERITSAVNHQLTTPHLSCTRGFRLADGGAKNSIPQIPAVSRSIS